MNQDRKMSESPPVESWRALERFLEEEKLDELTTFFLAMPADETARALSRLSDADQARVLETIGAANAADVLEYIPEAQAVEILEDLPVSQAASIVDEMPSAEQADLLGELNDADAIAILESMDPEDADEARLLMQYDPETAGGVMVTEFLSYPGHKRIDEIVDDLRRFRDRYKEYEIQYIYITDSIGSLIGVVGLRDLLLSPGDTRVDAIMLPDPLYTQTNTSARSLEQLFAEGGFLGVPVVTEKRRLVGVVRRSAVQEVLKEMATEDYLKMAGLTGHDELRTMPLTQRASKRLSWLSINIGLNILAASVIAIYQDTIAAVIALAVFLPIISDMSGCSGNQAVAVSLRELTLGLIKPYEFTRVFFKEVGIGLINGLILGLMLGGAAALWQQNVYLGVVVGAAMTLNTVIAVSLGGLLPLMLQRFRFDPALASSPILTTVTDMVGFFMVLNFATFMLPKLVA